MRFYVIIYNSDTDKERIVTYMGWETLAELKNTRPDDENATPVIINNITIQKKAEGSAPVPVLDEATMRVVQNNAKQMIKSLRRDPILGEVRENGYILTEASNEDVNLGPGEMTQGRVVGCYCTECQNIMPLGEKPEKPFSCQNCGEEIHTISYVPRTTINKTHNITGWSLPAMRDRIEVKINRNGLDEIEGVQNNVVSRCTNITMQNGAPGRPPEFKQFSYWVYTSREIDLTATDPDVHNVQLNQIIDYNKKNPQANPGKIFSKITYHHGNTSNTKIYNHGFDPMSVRAKTGNSYLTPDGMTDSAANQMPMRGLMFTVADTMRSKSNRWLATYRLSEDGSPRKVSRNTRDDIDQSSEFMFHTVLGGVEAGLMADIMTEDNKDILKNARMLTSGLGVRSHDKRWENNINKDTEDGGIYRTVADTQESINRQKIMLNFMIRYPVVYKYAIEKALHDIECHDAGERRRAEREGDTPKLYTERRQKQLFRNSIYETCGLMLNCHESVREATKKSTSIKNMYDMMHYIVFPMADENDNTQGRNDQNREHYGPSKDDQEFFKNAPKFIKSLYKLETKDKKRPPFSETKNRRAMFSRNPIAMANSVYNLRLIGFEDENNVYSVLKSVEQKSKDMPDTYSYDKHRIAGHPVSTANLYQDKKDFIAYGTLSSFEIRALPYAVLRQTNGTIKDDSVRVALKELKRSRGKDGEAFITALLCNNRNTQYIGKKEDIADDVNLTHELHDVVTAFGNIITKNKAICLEGIGTKPESQRQVNEDSEMTAHKELVQQLRTYLLTNNIEDAYIEYTANGMYGDAEETVRTINNFIREIKANEQILMFDEERKQLKDEGKTFEESIKILAEKYSAPGGLLDFDKKSKNAISPEMYLRSLYADGDSITQYVHTKDGHAVFDRRFLSAEKFKTHKAPDATPFDEKKQRWDDIPACLQELSTRIISLKDVDNGRTDFQYPERVQEMESRYDMINADGEKEHVYLILPKNLSELLQWGKELRNCIDNDYYDKIQNGESYIFGMVKADGTIIACAEVCPRPDMCLKQFQSFQDFSLDAPYKDPAMAWLRQHEIIYSEDLPDIKYMGQHIPIYRIDDTLHRHDVDDISGEIVSTQKLEQLKKQRDKDAVAAFKKQFPDWSLDADQSHEALAAAIKDYVKESIGSVEDYMPSIGKISDRCKAIDLKYDGNGGGGGGGGDRDRGDGGHDDRHDTTENFIPDEVVDRGDGDRGDN